MSNSRSIIVGIACGMGAGALWGTVFLAPELVPGFSPVQMSSARYLAYGIVAVVLLATRLRHLLDLLTPRDWAALTVLSVTGNTVYYILLSSAVQLAGIAMTSLIIGFLPVAVTIIGSRAKGAIPLSRLSLSLTLCACGVMCIGWQAFAMPQSASFLHQVAGLACAIGALASWTTFAVYNSHCLKRLETLRAHDWNLLTGMVTGAQAMLLAPFALQSGSSDHDVSQLLWFAAVMGGIAILASIVGGWLWNRMSRLLPLTMTGQMILFETAFALLYGLAWERRLPTLLEALAFAFVAGSVVASVSAHSTRLRRSIATTPDTPLSEGRDDKDDHRRCFSCRRRPRWQHHQGGEVL